MEISAPLIVDVRPMCEKGEAPLGTILNAAEQLRPGQVLVVVAPFEPVPLIGLLAQRGFSHSSKLRSDNAWEVTFQPSPGLF